jgi:hypothetical protein
LERLFARPLRLFSKTEAEMQSTMRARLQNTIAYHTAVAEAATDEEQRDLHEEVARQLQAVLDADPLVSAIDTAMATRTIRRETQIPRRRRLN